MKISDVSRFKSWHSKRSGHPLGVILGIDAVSELESEIERLELNYDRMVEEIAELKFSEVDLVNRNEDLLCIIDDLTRIARALDKPERHTNSQHKRAKRDLRKLIEKLNQEVEE